MPICQRGYFVTVWTGISAPVNRNQQKLSGTGSLFSAARWIRTQASGSGFHTEVQLSLPEGNNVGCRVATDGVHLG